MRSMILQPKYYSCMLVSGQKLTKYRRISIRRFGKPNAQCNSFRLGACYAIPCEQRYLRSRSLACQSYSWLVSGRKQTSYATDSDASDFFNAKSHTKKKPLFVG